MPGNAADHPSPASGETRGIYEVLNQPRALEDYDLYAGDTALREAVAWEGATWAEPALAAFGARIGAASYLQLGDLANRHPPELDTHDRYGRRVDLVRFHPAYHDLMRTAIGEGLHASPWAETAPGRYVARAARFYLHGQVEAGHLCPVTMTFASLACLRHQPDIAARWQPKILSNTYDPANAPIAAKLGATIGMAMTEKQGGSDVRANTTAAKPVGVAGPGREYALTGAKYFVSAPMSDAFLVLAQAPGGLSCFLVPRWRDDGTKNPMELQRLKRKLGNVSNATAEAELRGACGWMIGPEGRGIATILEMVAMTRFDCMLGTTALMRMAVSQAIDHGRQRQAFGRLLIDQPIMRNVLADLALEAEAALALSLRIARALEAPAGTAEAHLARLGTAVGKYWVCKRAVTHAAEAMECTGGSGFIEESPMARLYREAPVNAIWEGSGNVQCLDILRALQRTPEALDATFAEIEAARGANPHFDTAITALRRDLGDLDDFEERARDIVGRLAAALQASLLLRHAPPAVGDAFCASRFAETRLYGALPKGLDLAPILERARPR